MVTSIRVSELISGLVYRTQFISTLPFALCKISIQFLVQTDSIRTTINATTSVMIQQIGTMPRFVLLHLNEKGT